MRLLVLFLYGLTGVIFALPPLPPLPPLSGAAGSKDTKSASPKLPDLPPSPATSAVVPSSAPDAERIAPVMIEGKSGSEKISDVGSVDRAKNIDVVLKLLSDIEKNVSEFQTLEQEVGSMYAGLDKKLDSFYQVADMFVGQSLRYVEDTLASFNIKGAQLEQSHDAKSKIDELKQLMSDSKTQLEDVSKTLTAFKDIRGSLSREEDSLRQAVVDLKKNRSDFTSYYAKATSLKNDLISKGSDGKQLVDQITDAAKKSQELLDVLKTKNTTSIKDSIKKIEEMITKTTSDKDALSGKIDAVKKIVTSINQVENGMQTSTKKSAAVGDDKKNVDQKLQGALAENVVTQPEAMLKPDDALSQEPKKEKETDVVEGVGHNIASEVIQTIIRGGKFVGASLVGIAQKIHGAFRGEGQEQQELSSKRGALVGAVSSVGHGFWNVVLAGADYVKVVFKISWSALRGVFNAQPVLPVEKGPEVLATSVNNFDKNAPKDVPQEYSKV